MGMLINGGWTSEDRYIEKGAFVRPASAYHHDIPPELVDAMGASPKRACIVSTTMGRTLCATKSMHQSAHLYGITTSFEKAK